MEKRIFLAIAISIAVLVGWSWLAPKLFPDLIKKPAPAKPAEPAQGNGHATIKLPDEPQATMSLAKDPLGNPEKIAEQLEGASAQPLVHIPLPGWVWSRGARGRCGGRPGIDG